MKKTVIFRIAAMLSVLALASGTAAYAAAPPDVAGKPYEGAVGALADRGIITGDVDGNFYPDSSLTRAQFCTIVVKAMKAPVATVEGSPTQAARTSGFPDMQGYGWADGYIAYAIEKGVVAGYPDGTFRPGSNVSMSELITMTLRAAGYSDAELGGVWPENYLAKAGDIGALEGITAPLPEYATKWMAAQLVWNALSLIEENNPPVVEPGADGETSSPQDPPSGDGLAYMSGKFDQYLQTFGGKYLALDVKVLTYGVKADYSSTMKLSEKSGDYIEETVYKYKNVETPAWYELKNDRITRIILPSDVGFSGFAYGVINGTLKMGDRTGGENDGFITLSAGRAITWQGASSLPSGSVPAAYGNGEVFELQLRNARVTNVGSCTTGAFNGRRFVELSTPGAFSLVESRTGDVVTIEGNVYSIRSNASVYSLGDDGQYSVSSVSNVRAGSLVRMYDVSDDDDDSTADIVVIKEE
ncbi:MAG: S-layer homology domain-containing protein [Clostridiales Family XIII bacterium]|jgi:hypothetical protein|nr:S-layer homology domain-containing protein [Clostridiales Family XIII bacterium]